MIPIDMDDGYTVEYHSENEMRKDLAAINTYLGCPDYSNRHFSQIPLDDFATYITGVSPTVLKQENGRTTLALDWSNSVLGSREDLLSHREHRKPDIKSMIHRIRRSQAVRVR